MKRRHLLPLFAALLMAVSCNENTGIMGIPSSTDIITSDTATFYFTTRSVLLDSVVGNSSVSYLGRIFDYETRTNVQADFLAQFACLESYFKDADSVYLKPDVVADSCDICLYYSSYYGDDDNPMKIYVYPVDSSNIIKEGVTYYSNIDLTQFVDLNREPIATKMFSVTDYTVATAIRNSSAHSANVRIFLPTSYGTRLLRLAATHPEYFKNSWSFIHKVCPGFVFFLRSGFGTMLTLNVSALNVYTHYNVNTDSIVKVSKRFSATPEVIQSTSVTNHSLSNLELTDVDFTYLKSPAGVATEITFPIDEIYAGHENDSVSKARITLTRYNVAYKSPYTDEMLDELSEYFLPAPSTVLMVPKSKMREFFANREVANFETSFTTDFSENYNGYTFSNISRLLSSLFRVKQSTMKSQNLSSAEFNALYPDWNKVIVLPVTVSTVTDNSSGLSAQSSVSNSFSVTSTRIVGGTKPVRMSIIYSKYK